MSGINKSVLITGSTRGLGKSLALEFSKNGYDVIIHGRDERLLNELKESILKEGVNCEIVAGELEKDEIIEKLSEKAREKNISVLINNAGKGMAKTFLETSVKDFEYVINVNLLSVIKLTKKIYPLFVERGSGIIVNINSMSGLKTKDLLSAYSSSKFGLKGFTDSLRFEAKNHGVKVVGVYPSGMKTDMSAEWGKDNSKCMDTMEVAEVIFNSCKEYKSLCIDEILISRMEY